VEEIAVDVFTPLEGHCDSDDETAGKPSDRDSMNVFIIHIHPVPSVEV
jgi:hypothetical protein